MEHTLSVAELEHLVKESDTIEHLNFSSKVYFFREKLKIVLDFFTNIDILYINTIYLHRKDKKWRTS